MVNKKSEFKFITNEELKEKIKNHLLSLRWEKNIEHDFSWYYFWDWTSWTWKNKKEYFLHEVFENANLSKVDFRDSEIILNFKNTNLEESDFRWAKLKLCNFIRSNLKWADLRWAEYNTSNFTDAQLWSMILTDNDYNEYQEKKKLEKENKKLKKEVKIKGKTLKNTSDKQTDILTKSFEKLENNFLLEEKQWLIISFVVFMSLLFLLLIPVFDIFAYEITHKLILWWLILIIWIIWTVTIMLATVNINRDEEKEEWFWRIIYNTVKNIWNRFKRKWFIILIFLWIYMWIIKFINWVSIPEKSVFNIDSKFVLLPIWILLTSFLYFSIYQYWKSKKLRIENGNKVALLHWFIAIKSDTWTDMRKWRFYDNVADVVFSKIYSWKENNLPVDKILDIIKLIDRK